MIPQGFQRHHPRNPAPDLAFLAHTKFQQFTPAEIGRHTTFRPASPRIATLASTRRAFPEIRKTTKARSARRQQADLARLSLLSLLLFDFYIMCLPSFVLACSGK